MGKRTLEPAFYMRAVVLTASWEGPILFTEGLENLSFIADWTDAGSPVGELQLWVSNDPRARQDHVRGLTIATGAAAWKQVKLPAGSVDVDGVTATWAADDDDVDVTGVGAGRAAINVVDVYAFAKLVYVRSGGGAADTMTVTREGN